MSTERRQFRVLHREFFFRLVDRELLSPQATGDVSRLITQCAALLICISAVSLIPALNFAAAMPPLARLIYATSIVHFFIATTMLAVGLFAVWCWEAMYPDKRDVLVLAPLPVRARTVFLAKMAGNVTALALTVGALHLVAGLAWPLTLNKTEPAYRTPLLTSDAALPPLGAADLQAVLDRDLAAARRDGPLAPGTGGGIAIGVSARGVRRVFAYGAARPDSLFEIGSITKTMTGLVLARMVEQGRVRLDEPVRELLAPEVTLARPADGREITLRDLATHHSGLPSFPSNLSSTRQPAATMAALARYDRMLLHDYLRTRGLERPGEPPFRYSNLGFGLLGHALAVRAQRAYPELVRDLVLTPLGLSDTAIALSDGQRRRFLQGHDDDRRPTPAHEMGLLAGCGAHRATAGDMLTWLEANLHPERLRDRELAAAIVASHWPQAARPGGAIGLAWGLDTRSGTIMHSGATAGFTADAWLNPAEDVAVVVLSNVRPGSAISADLVSQHVRARLQGAPAVAIAEVDLPARGGIVSLLRLLAAWWITMFAAGLFVFSVVMGVQGLAAWMLPRRWFVRVSSLLQMGTFASILILYCAQAFVTRPPLLAEAQAQSLLGLFITSPSYWFLGMFQQISGSPLLAPLARSAWIGLALAVAMMTIAYALSYFHVFRRIAEEPDIAPHARRARWLPRFGGGPATGVVQFALRTLLRSSPHRVILAFYWGIGLAIALFVLKTPAAEALTQVSTEERWLDFSVPLMTASILILTLAVIGARVLFALPRELRANWIFRIMPLPGGTRLMVIRRRALAVASVAPVLLISTPSFLAIWPWPQAVGHLIVLALAGALLVELWLPGAQKVPFTCSYLPGKSTLHLTFWVGLVLFVPLVMRLTTFERDALQYPARFAQLAGGLAAAWLCARAWNTWRIRTAGDALAPVFDEEAPGTMVGLNVWDSRVAAAKRGEAIG